VLNNTASNYLKEKTYTSFSGADIIASIKAMGGKPMVFGELQTITYSTHREIRPIRSVGSINPRGFTRGPRTIAGSLIFTVFDRHVIQNVLKEGLLAGTPGSGATDIAKNIMTDEMPPFDITVSFINEYGTSSRLAIYGIIIVDEGQVMSIDDMITENTMSYIAHGIQLMTNEETFTSSKEEEKTESDAVIELAYTQKGGTRS